MLSLTIKTFLARSFAVLALAIVSFTSVARAEEEDGKANAQETNAVPTLKAVNIVERVPNGGTAVRCFITARANKFSLVVPHQFTAQPDPQNKKIYVGRPLDQYLMTIEVTEQVQPGAASSADVLEKKIRGDYPNAEIAGQSATSVDEQSGQVFDLRWKNNGRGMGARVVCVPFPTAIVELKLVGPVVNGELSTLH
jgi:hypothetical protein